MMRMMVLFHLVSGGAGSRTAMMQVVVDQIITDVTEEGASGDTETPRPWENAVEYQENRANTNRRQRRWEYKTTLIHRTLKK